MAGIVGVLVLLLLGGVAHAQEAPPGYQEAADLAVEEFSHGNYLEARARFARAYELWPTARSARALGYCEYELKNYVAALTLLREALASQVRPLTATQREETTQLEAKTRGYVAHFVVETVPADARLTLDGNEVQRALDVSMGEHTFEASAPGHQNVRRAVQAQGGSDSTLRLELPRVVEAKPLVEAKPMLAAPAPERRDEPQPLRKKWWLWTAVGVVVVAGVTAGLVAGLHDPGIRDPSGGNTDVSVPVGQP